MHLAHFGLKLITLLLPKQNRFKMHMKYVINNNIVSTRCFICIAHRFLLSLMLLVITAHFPVHVAVNKFHFSLTYKLSKWSNLLQKIETIKFCCGPDLEATQVTQPYLA